MMSSIKSFIFSFEKPNVAICTPDHRSPAFVMEQAQINEFVAKVAELGERVKQIRIAEEAERERQIAAENAALKAAQEELVRKQAFEEKALQEEERKRLEAEEKARREEEESKQTKIEMQQKEIAKKVGEESMGNTISSKIPDVVLYVIELLTG